MISIGNLLEIMSPAAPQLASIAEQNRDRLMQKMEAELKYAPDFQWPTDWSPKKISSVPKRLPSDLSH